MKAFYVEAEWAPKEGYKLSEREISTKRAMRGNSIWKNIRGSIQDKPMPTIKENEVLIKIGAAGICGTDAHLLQKDADGYSLYNGHSRYPIITGHEFSGEVVEVGSLVSRLKAGDLVAVESMHWCGECDPCRGGHFNQCSNLDEPGLTFDGGFAEYTAVREKHCYKLNDVLEYYQDKKAALELGAVVEPAGVAYNGLFVRGGGIRPGGHVAVFGAGPVGLAAIALMKTSGAAKLFCFEMTPERRKLALDMGADYVYSPKQLADEGIDAGELLMEKTNGKGISLFAECAGATKATYPVMEQALAINGKAVQIGHMLGKTPIDLYPFMFKAGSISGSNGQSGLGIYADVIALMASGRIDMRKAISARVTLDRIEDGLKMAAEGTAGKVIVTP